MLRFIAKNRCFHIATKSEDSLCFLKIGNLPTFNVPISNIIALSAGDSISTGRNALTTSHVRIDNQPVTRNTLVPASADLNSQSAKSRYLENVRQSSMRLNTQAREWTATIGKETPTPIGDSGIVAYRYPQLNDKGFPTKGLTLRTATESIPLSKCFTDGSIMWTSSEEISPILPGVLLQHNGRLLRVIDRTNRTGDRRIDLENEEITLREVKSPKIQLTESNGKNVYDVKLDSLDYIDTNKVFLGDGRVSARALVDDKNQTQIYIGIYSGAIEGQKGMWLTLNQSAVLPEDQSLFFCNNDGSVNPQSEINKNINNNLTYYSVYEGCLVKIYGKVFKVTNLNKDELSFTLVEVDVTSLQSAINSARAIQPSERIVNIPDQSSLENASANNIVTGDTFQGVAKEVESSSKNSSFTDGIENGITITTKYQEERLPQPKRQIQSSNQTGDWLDLLSSLFSGGKDKKEPTPESEKRKPPVKGMRKSASQKKETQQSDVKVEPQRRSLGGEGNSRGESPKLNGDSRNRKGGLGKKRRLGE